MDDSGKWLLFTPVAMVDSDWALIRMATARGRLGYKSKVSTMRPNPNARDENTKVICVYTTLDVADQDRVLASLRMVGWREGELCYKEDRLTRAGVYGGSGKGPATNRREVPEQADTGGPWWVDTKTKAEGPVISAAGQEARTAIGLVVVDGK